VSLLVVGLKYGQQSALVEDLITDRLETPVALLRANDPSAAQVAIDGVALAAEAARQLGKITNIAFMGPDAKVPREGPKAKSAKAAQLIVAEDLYGTLDAPFRKFLLDLGGADDPELGDGGAPAHRGSRAAPDGRYPDPAGVRRRTG
jgi:hypothetical protein